MFVLQKLSIQETKCTFINVFSEKICNTVGYCYAELVMCGWQRLLILAELEKQANVKGPTLVFLTIS